MIAQGNALIFAHIFSGVGPATARNRESGAFRDGKAASCRRTPKRPAALPLDADLPEAACATAGVFARFGVRWHDTAFLRRPPAAELWAKIRALPWAIIVRPFGAETRQKFREPLSFG